MINYYIDIMVTREIFDGLSLRKRHAAIQHGGVFQKECHRFEKCLQLYELGDFLVEACFNDKYELIQIEVISHTSAVLFYDISCQAFSSSMAGKRI
ncbi:hypothetical protein [Fulvivirga sediminis]|uniref:Uncharacterized protein n=1 Tax=Fulvivirga sediminis TaxID=2803949 RepID=A0A937FD00_9BACT|nr:hypothetical protein [Fulvivirga sediminis]MBL3658158.1 hypothetical protein [Fulvivirga sediminis]